MFMGQKTRFYFDVQSLQQGVTYSNNLVTVSYPNGEKEMFLVDFGMYQGSCEQMSKLNPEIKFHAENLVGILLTHAHIDHSGRIPMLYKNRASCRTFMTEDTMKVAEKLLRNTASIIAMDKLQDQIFDFNDLEHAIKEFRACEYDEFVQMTPNIKVKFIQNQHVPGAATLYIVISYPGEEDITMLFSGDYNIKNSFSERTTEIPSEILEKPLSMLMLESTYGSRKKKEEEKGKFRKEIAEFAKAGKTIIIPAFAYCRYQTILQELKFLQDEGNLSTSIPIFIDGGLGIELTYLWKYLETVECKDFMPQNMRVVEERKSYLMSSKWQKIIVTTSGMGNFGPAREYIPNYISDKKAVIYLTGYASQDSTARKILEAEEGELLTVSGIVREKHAIVRSTGEFSSHARKEDLIEFVKKFTKINFLLLNHGDDEAKQALSEALYKFKEEKKIKDIGIVDGMTDFRITKHKKVKTFPI